MKASTNKGIQRAGQTDGSDSHGEGLHSGGFSQPDHAGYTDVISAVSASAVGDKPTFTILQNGENPSSGFGFGQIPESPADPFGGR